MKVRVLIGIFFFARLNGVAFAMEPFGAEESREEFTKRIDDFKERGLLLECNSNLSSSPTLINSLYSILANGIADNEKQETTRPYFESGDVRNVNTIINALRTNSRIEHVTFHDCWLNKATLELLHIVFEKNQKIEITFISPWLDSTLVPQFEEMASHNSRLQFIMRENEYLFATFDPTDEQN